MGGGGGSTTHAINNYVGHVRHLNGGTSACFTGTFASESYNVSSDSTAAGTGSQTLKSDYATYFADATSGSENLHLRSTSATLWGSAGADLDEDSDLPVLDDIDGDARDSSTPDIGADELPHLQQVHTRWRNDDAGEATATWAAAEDAALTGLDKSTPRRVRFEVLNASDTSATAAYTLQVTQASTGSVGTYADVPVAATGHWQITGSSLTDGEATTNVAGGLTDEGTSFVAGQARDAGATTGSLSLPSGDFTEIEFAAQATTNAIDGATYCFRLLDETRTSPLQQYTAYARVTLSGTLPSLTLTDHAAGQVPDAFGATTPVTAGLFGFRLSRTGSVTVDAVRMGFTTASGVANGDVTSGELWADVNGDGQIDGGDTSIQTGVAPTAGVLTFTTNFQPATTGTSYLVRATVASLTTADTTTLSLGLADIDTVSWGQKAGATVPAVHTADAGTVVYYSVGTSYPGNLMNGTISTLVVTISGGTGTATFNRAQPDDIGVGDGVTYGGGTAAYVAGRSSSTAYTLRTATGGTPANVTDSPVTSITRAFGSLEAAEAGPRPSWAPRTRCPATSSSTGPATTTLSPTPPTSSSRNPGSPAPATTSASTRPSTPPRSGSPSDTTGPRAPGTAWPRPRPAAATTRSSRSERTTATSGSRGSRSTAQRDRRGRGLRDRVRRQHGPSEDVRISHCLIHDIANSTSATDRDVAGIDMFDSRPSTTRVNSHLQRHQHRGQRLPRPPACTSAPRA